MTRHTLALLSAAGLTLATHLFAAGTNDVPYLEPFESYAVGQNMLSVQGWEGNPLFGGPHISNDAGDLARLAAYTNAGGGLPLAGPHDQLLTVPLDAQNTLDGPQGSIVLTDVLVQPEFRALPAPEADPTMQLGVYVNSNGLLVLYHQNLITGTNEWDELSDGPVIASNSWIRLRVTKDYANHSFQLRINEDPPVSDPAGWDGPLGGGHPGPWFRMVQTNGALQRVMIRASGNTVIDDLVVTSGEAVIETLAAANIGVGQADLRGFLSHTGLSSTAVEVYYGTSNGGTNPAAWGATNTWAAPRPQGLHLFSTNGLAEVLHYYRFAALNGSARSWAEDTQSFSPYAISISAPDDAAEEDGPETGTIRVSRPAAATNGALTVNLDIGGTADNGVDYVSIGDTIELAHGQADADITITPIVDPVEGNETVVISIAPGGYIVGTPSNATVTIVDRPMGDLTWNNGSGDGSWNTSSLNWLGGVATFVDGDSVNFIGIAPGDVYIGDGQSSNAVDVYTTLVVVDDNDYTFVGGEVLSGEVQVKTLGTLIHPELGQNSFGSLIRLQGGELRRALPLDAPSPQTFTNDIIVELESVLTGSQGNSTWGGDLDLRDRLNLSPEPPATPHTGRQNAFTGTITLDQDTNNVNERVIYQRGESGTATFSGAIVDDTNATHTGTFPLHIGTRTGSGNITFTGANSYSHGTTVMYVDGVEGNTTAGLVVDTGSSLGTGPVTVQGIAGQGGALLTLNASNAVRDTLTIEPQAQVVVNAAGAVSKDAGPITVQSNAVLTLNAPNAVQRPLTLEPDARVVVNAPDAVSESVGTITVHHGATLELNTGTGINDTVTLSLMATGRVDVKANDEFVGALIVNGVNQSPGVYRAADHPGYILGTGSIEVDPPLDAILLIVR